MRTCLFAKFRVAKYILQIILCLEFERELLPSFFILLYFQMEKKEQKKKSFERDN